MRAEATVEGRPSRPPTRGGDAVVAEDVSPTDAIDEASSRCAGRGRRDARGRRCRRPARRRRRDATAADATTPATTTTTTADRLTPTGRPPARCAASAAILPAVPDRLPRPVRRSCVSTRSASATDVPRRAWLGPSDAPDGWWLTLLWVADDEGVVSFRDVAPAAGPPPDPPLARLGPARRRRPVRAHPRGRRPAPAAGRRRSCRPTTPTRPWRAPLADPGGLPLRAGAGRGDAAERARGHRSRRVPPRVEGLAGPDGDRDG